MRYCVHISEHNPQTETIVGGPYASMDLCNSNCIPFSDLYIVNLIDEADPNYSASLNGFNFGNLWSKDVSILDTALTNASFNDYFISVFDIGNRPKAIGQEIWPSGAIITNNITNSPCYLPIPIRNIIPTTRPVKNDDASQRNLKTFMSSALQAKYGSFSSIATNNPNATFVFIVDDSGSMTYNETVRYAFEDSGGIDGLVTAINDAGLRCIVLASCKSERWLQWSATVLNNISTIINTYDADLDKSIPFSNTALANQGINFCEGCETLIWVNDENQPKVSLSLQGRTGTGTLSDSEGGTESWTIEDIVGTSSNPIGNWSYVIYDQNAMGALSNSINIYLKCVSGVLLLDAVSECSDNRNFDLGEPSKLQRYYWDNIEIPVNSDGFPYGPITLPTPDYVCTDDSILEADSACYEFEPNETQTCTPVTPNIVFSYQGSPVSNPCS